MSLINKLLIKQIIVFVLLFSTSTRSFLVTCKLDLFSSTGGYDKYKVSN